MEEGWQGLLLETPEGAVGLAVMGGEGYRGRTEFLEGTRVGRWSSARVKIGPREGEDQESGGKEGGPGPL